MFLLYSILLFMKTQNVMNDRGHSKYAGPKTERIVQETITLTFTTYDRHFNLYYTSQLVIRFKAPVYGDFTLTLQPIVWS